MKEAIIKISYGGILSLIALSDAVTMPSGIESISLGDTLSFASKLTVNGILFVVVWWLVKALKEKEVKHAEAIEKKDQKIEKLNERLISVYEQRSLQGV